MQSVENPGLVYQFRLRNRKVDGTETWSCSDCENRRRQMRDGNPIPSIEVDGSRHISDPQRPSNEHFCEGKRREDVTAKKIVRQVKETVEQTGSRPKETFQAAKRQLLV